MKEKRAGDKSVKRLLGYLAPWKTRYGAGLLVTALDPNVRACYYGFNQVNAGLTLAGSLGLGMFLYHQGILSLAALPLLIQMGTMVVSPIAELGWIWDGWNEMVPRIRRVTELLDQEKEDMAGERGAMYPLARARRSGQSI